MTLAIDAFLEGVCASVCVAASLLALMGFKDTRLFAAGIKKDRTHIKKKRKKKKRLACNHHKRRV